MIASLAIWPLRTESWILHEGSSSRAPSAGIHALSLWRIKCWHQRWYKRKSQKKNRSQKKPDCHLLCSSTGNVWTLQSLLCKLCKGILSQSFPWRSAKGRYCSLDMIPWKYTPQMSLPNTCPQWKRILDKAWNGWNYANQGKPYRVRNLVTSL